MVRPIDNGVNNDLVYNKLMGEIRVDSRKGVLNCCQEPTIASFAWA